MKVSIEELDLEVDHLKVL